MTKGTIAAAIALLAALPVAARPLPEVALDHSGLVLRVAVVGDVGAGASAVAAGIGRLNKVAPMAGIVIAGDNFYPCGVRSLTDPLWKSIEPLTSLGVPLIVALGNHDYCRDPDVQVQATGIVANWIMPARQYVVRNPLADFVVIDSTPVAEGESLDAIEALRSGFSTSRSPWRIVVGHHPPLSSGYHGYVTRNEVKNVRQLVEPLRAQRVDLYIGGHEHHQELLRWKPNILVSGAGSQPIVPITLRRQTVWPKSIQREPIGFALLEITRPEMRVQFYDRRGTATSEWLRVAKKDIEAKTKPPSPVRSSPQTER